MGEAELTLIDEELKKVKKQISTKQDEEKLSKLLDLPLIAIQILDTQELKHAYRASLESTHVEAENVVRAHIQEHVRNHETSEAFLRSGLDQVIDVCPFCGQDLKDAQRLLRAYNEFFGEAHRTLLNDLLERINVIEEWNPRADILKMEAECSKLDSAIDQLKNFGGSGGKIEKIDFEEASMGFEKAKGQVLVSLRRKSDNLTFIPPEEEVAAVEEIYGNLDSQINSVNKLFLESRENARKYFSSIKSLSLGSLEDRQKQLQESRDRFSTNGLLWCGKYGKIKEQLTEATSNVATLTTKLSDYSKQVFENYQKDINQTLENLAVDFRLNNLSEQVDNKVKDAYAEFQLVINKTHEVPLRSHGDNPSFLNTLSDGEKNALSFAFFVNWIKRQANLNEKIVVFDDPLSSFDEHRKNLTARIIKELSIQFRQTIILTHSKEFLFLLHEKFDSPNVLSINKDMSSGSNLILYDIERELKDPQQQRIEDMELYLETDRFKVDEIQGKIRLCLETALNRKYFKSLHNTKTLGSMLDHLESEKKLGGDNLAELRELNEVSSASHHGESTINPLKNLTRGELLPDVRRTIQILERI